MNLEKEMSLSTALSIVTTATEMRADVWREAAKGYLVGSSELDCFEESSPMECNDMAALLDQAREVVDLFRENYRSVVDGVDEDLLEGGP